VSVGGQVVDRIIRYGEAERIKSTAPVKPKTDTQRPKTMSAAAMVTVKREKPLKKDRAHKHKKARLADQWKKNLQVIEEDESVSSVGAVVDEESPLREREIDVMNESIMVDQLVMEGDRPGGSDVAAVVDVKQVVRRVPPASPMAKESLGNCLMKVGDSVCIRGLFCGYVHSVCEG